MTDKEKAIVMAYTGICMLAGDKFQIFHKYVDDIMGRPIWTGDIGWLEKEIKEKSKADFIALCANESSSENPNKWIPVNQPPKAEWKDIYAESEGSNSWIEFTCPHCGNAFGIESGQYGWSYGDAIPWKACPMCGGLAEHEPYKAESEVQDADSD